MSKDLMAGRVEPKDFERYVYGRGKNEKQGLDARDEAEAITRAFENKTEREAMAYKPKSAWNIVYFFSIY